MSNEVSIGVKVQDNATASMGKISKAGEDMASKVSGSVSKLGNAIGGEVGEIVNRFGEGFEQIAKSGTSALTKISVGAGVVAGVGVAIQAMTSKSQAAEQQLEAQVNTTGDSWDDYSKKVSAAVSMEANYAHGISDTDTALRILDQATGSMDTSLSDLNLVTNIAAARHITLAAAATLVAKVYSGSGSKTLKQYGIDMKVAAGNTQEASDALAQWSVKVDGQANAASDTFSGKVAAARTKIADWGDEILSVAGGPLTELGGAVSLVTGLMEVSATVTDYLRGKHATNALATVAESGAQDRLAQSAALASGTQGDLAASTTAASAAATRSIVPLQGAAAAEAELGSAATGASVALGAGGASGLLGSLGMFAPALGPIAVGIVDMKLTLDDTTAALKQHGAAMGVVTAAQNLLTGGADGAARGLVNLSKSLFGGKSAAEQAKPAITGVAASAADMAVDVKNAATAMGTLKDAEAEAGAGANTVAQAFKEITSPAEDMYKGTLGVADSIKSFTDQVAAAKKGNDKFATSLSDSTDTGRANVESVLNIIDGINQLTLKSQQSGDTTAVTTGKINAMNASLETAAKKAGIGKDSLQQLINQYETNPTTLAYQVTVDATNALSTLTTLQGKIAYLNSLKLSNPAAYGALSEAETKGQGGVQSGYASGGIVGGAATGGPRGGMFWVGEHGPELAQLAPGSQVHSNPDSMRMASQGGGTPQINITIAPGGGITELERALLQWLRRTIRVTGGGNVQKTLGHGQ